MSPRPRIVVTLLVGALCLASLTTACTSDEGAGADPETTLPSGIHVDDATVDWPANPSTAALRMVVRNGGDADVLTAVSSPVAEHATVHRSEVDAEGQATMVAAPELDIPARSSVTFEPSGLHVMLTGISSELEVGDTVAFTLTFEHAGEVTASAQVVEPGSAATSGEDDHGH